jgi:hypothetical protein
MAFTLSENLQTVRQRPMLKDPLSFFEYKQGNRLFMTITDSPQAWREDLGLAERLFADMIVVPFGDAAIHREKLTETQEVLKQRMKYPGVKETPELEAIAKTWVLPTKVSMGPSASCFFEPTSTPVGEAFQPVFESLTPGESKLHIVKVEVANGLERPVLYKLLDECFRPSLLLVKWSYDLDEHLPTAHCAGHLISSGYCHLAFENGYSLYMFRNDPLLDICSFKACGLTNPILSTILQTVSIQQTAVHQSSIQHTDTPEQNLPQQ